MKDELTYDKAKMPVTADRIAGEDKFRQKRRDKSVIDEIEGIENKSESEAKNLITSYVNKIDLAEKFCEVIPLYYDMAKLWWRWDGHRKCFRITDDVEILNLISGASGANIIKSQERTEILNAVKQVARKNKPKDVKKTWIQFNSEIVDFKTGDRFQATPEYFLTNPIPWDLGKTEDTPVMDRIFIEWVGEDFVRTLQEIAAYCLLTDYPLQRLFFLIGGGMNGKSCYLDLLKRFLGVHNICSTELDILMNSRFEITRLHKKLLCQMGECNFTEMRKTSILKKLCGRDLVGFEYKNKDPFEDMNYAKIVIATNNLPTTLDKTLGFYRRCLIIDFPNRFDEKKDILDEISDQEYNNLGLKCVKLLMALLDKREFHKEGSVEDRMKKYEDRADFLQKFLDDFVSDESESYISKSDFYKKFGEWCDSNKFRHMDESTLGKKMKDKEIGSSRKHAEWLHDGRGGQMRIWLGIRWKEQE